MSTSSQLTQLIYPDTTVNANAGWCLWFTQEVYKTPHIYRSAWEAWEDTKSKHTERQMPNVSVPCFFEHWGTYGTPPTYGNWGHAVAYIPEIGFLSSPGLGYGQKLLKSLEEVEKYFNCKYVGWSEDLSGIKIVWEGETMNKEQAIELSLYARLAAGSSVEDANKNSEYDVEHILADAGYAAALCKQLYESNELFRYKASHYDEDVKNAQSQEFIKVTDLYIKK